jgi:hypothetical protein
METQLKIRQIQEEKFWTRRSNQASIWITINSVQNIYIQMLATFKPYSYNHRISNLVYTFFSILALIGVYLNFKKKMHCFNMQSLMLLVIRIAVRMLDKEESY